MQKLTLIAPDPRDVPLPDGRIVTVAPGEQIEIDDAAHAAALARQPDVWQRAPEKPPTAARARKEE